MGNNNLGTFYHLLGQFLELVFLGLFKIYLFSIRFRYRIGGLRFGVAHFSNFVQNKWERDLPSLSLFYFFRWLNRWLTLIFRLVDLLVVKKIFSLLSFGAYFAVDRDRSGVVQHPERICTFSKHSVLPHLVDD